MKHSPTFGRLSAIVAGMALASGLAARSRPHVRRSACTRRKRSRRSTGGTGHGRERERDAQAVARYDDAARAIRAKVVDYLRKSKALETRWHRPITGEQLQAELDRMARGSRDHQSLSELFGALNNDPFLIAEDPRPTVPRTATRSELVCTRRRQPSFRRLVESRECEAIDGRRVARERRTRFQSLFRPDA
jgi:hypothetical protein